MERGDRTVERGNDHGRWGITYDLHAEINRAREPGDDRVKRMARRGTWLFPCTSGRSRCDDTHVYMYVQSATVRSVKGLQSGSRDIFTPLPLSSAFGGGVSTKTSPRASCFFFPPASLRLPRKF